MLLSFRSINKLVDILTGQLYDFVPENKKFIDDILKSINQNALIEAYDACFAGKDDIIRNHQYGTKIYKLQQYTREKIEELNGQRVFESFIIESINLVRNAIYQDIFLRTEFYGIPLMGEDVDAKIAELVKSLNDVFIDDNVSIEYIKQSQEYKIYSLDDSFVVYNCLFNETQTGNYTLINEHNHKCHDKILAGDFSGAITNSRSLLEQILREIELSIHRKENTGRRQPGYNGAIEVLLGRVLDKLNITEKLTEKPKKGYEMIQSGFKDINAGISLLRHGMSDAHNISFEPTKKDALLAVNSAKTLANFLVEVYFEKYGA